MKTRMCLTGFPLWRAEHKVQPLFGIISGNGPRKAAKISCNFFPNFSQYLSEDVTTKSNALNSITQ